MIDFFAIAGITALSGTGTIIGFHEFLKPSIRTSTLKATNMNMREYMMNIMNLVKPAFI
jgi:hypothetical protein